MQQTTNSADLNTLRSNLLSVGTNEVCIDILKRIYEGNFNGFTMNFEKTDLWRLCLRINYSKRYSDMEKKVFTDHVKTLDTSDTRKTYLCYLEGINARTSEEMENLWNSLVDENRTYNYREMSYVLSGFMMP